MSLYDVNILLFMFNVILLIKMIEMLRAHTPLYILFRFRIILPHDRYRVDILSILMR